MVIINEYLQKHVSEARQAVCGELPYCMKQVIHFAIRGSFVWICLPVYTDSRLLRRVYHNNRDVLYCISTHFLRIGT